MEDVCFAVAAALDNASIDAVLTGGSAATIYAPEAYTSLDADFVLRREIKASALTQILASLGYHPAAARGMFEHPKSRFTIDFPKGPLAVGGDYVQGTAILRRGSTKLRILTPTDCVKDRLAHFYFWDDLSALNVAVAVAKSPHGSDVNPDELKQWTERESRGDKDFRPRLALFFERAQISPR